MSTKPQEGSASVAEAQSPKRGAYENLRSFCLFIGPDRCGHGLLGSMLDAHPDAVIAGGFSVFDEVGVTGKLAFDDPLKMFSGIGKRSRKDWRAGRRSRRARGERSEVTSHAIEGQGPIDKKPAVIGSDRAPATARALNANPGVLDELAALSQLDVKLIHVVRNPFDNLASLSFAAPGQPVFETYRWIADTTVQAERQGAEILHVHLEDLIEDPAVELTRVCEFLGLEPSPEYLTKCAAIVVSPPHDSRNERTWSRRQLEEMDGVMASYPWLERYRSAPPPKDVRENVAWAERVGMTSGLGVLDDGSEDLAKVHTFCAFIGHTRCGHSLVGALIDAHPNAAIPHQGKVFGEDDTAGHLAFVSREKLFRWVVERASMQAEKGRSGQRRTEGGERDRYSYEVPGQWQGRFTELQVLGLKQAEEMSNAVRANRRALDELNELTGLPLKLISMVRNPWDNVASMGRGVPVEQTELRDRIVDSYIFRSRMVQRARDDGYDVIDVFLDDLSANPQQELGRLCEFLGLKPLPDYLDACAALVLDKPNRPATEHPWTENDITKVTAAISEFPWLERYKSVEPPVPA